MNQTQRNELVECVSRKLEEKRLEKAVVLRLVELHPPRYDKVFEDGVEWLNRLEVKS